MTAAALTSLVFALVLVVNVAIAITCGVAIAGLAAAFFTTVPLYIRQAVSTASEYERAQSERHH